MKRITSDPDKLKDEKFDVIVIGSGYGGAITASRLARAGQRVCLLERGREILPGEFPDTLSEVRKDMQIQLAHGRVGSETGLFDIHIEAQQNVVVGCGLGGTSLINANVSLEPTLEVMTDPAWPEPLRNDLDGLLQQGFERAAEMLKPTPYPENYPPLNKLKAHEKSAEAFGVAFSRPPINVTFETPPGGVNHVGVEQSACTNCGDCVSGCNYSAKNTTQMNYLPDAWNHGAEIFCEVSVRYLEKVAKGWRVHCKRVGARQGKEGEGHPDDARLSVQADMVVLAAGTLGSNEILLRSREFGLSLSDRLGHGFTGNGDVLGFGYNCDQPVDGVGFGKLQRDNQKPVGPCITGIIDLRHAEARDERMVIEEGSLPSAIGPLLPMAMASAAGLLGQDTDDGILDELQEHSRAWESVVRGPYHGAVNHTQTYLAMSHDDGNGQILLENDRLRIDWPNVGEQANFKHVHDRLTQATAALGGTYVKNPIWSPLMNKSLVTVHPLGGCCMGEDGSKGVVNHQGQVFSGNDTAVHDRLYVSDGSVIPTSLAVNPLLTISALAERCCALMARDHGWTISYKLPSATTRKPLSKTVGLRFTETMRGYFSAGMTATGDELAGYLDAARQGRRAGTDMSFTLTIASDDLDAMLANSQHPAEITHGTVVCQALSSEPLTISSGEFRLFEQLPAQPDIRQMRYRVRLKAQNGEVYFLDGFKQIQDDPDTLDLWSDTTTLYVRVYQGTDENGTLVGKAVLTISPTDFFHQLTTIEITNTKERDEKLAVIARFGRFFAGELYDIYGGVFHHRKVSHPPRKKRQLRAPEPAIYPIQTDDGVNLRLTRYQGGQKGPVMLVHGLGVGSTIFSTDMIDTNLVEFLVAGGYDVWLLDYRVSILLPSSARASNADQVAQYDFPAAVAKICSETGAASIQAMVHCYGATTFFMSMLNGLKGVRSIVCSQIATDIVVPSVTRIKTGLYFPTILERFGVNSLTAQVPEDGGSALTQLYDRTLSLYAKTQAQGNCNTDPCHRITFMYGSLYRHDQLNDVLHHHLHELFGAANIESLKHLATMCRAGKLLDAEGNDVYLPQLARLDLPILFISGAENQCYLPESTQRTYDKLCQQFGPEQYHREEIPGYGHIDCIFGHHAHQDVFHYILNHLEKTAVPE
ncbi:alpha/beta fold hydrolase [Photobacterium galatheae]|uniref:Cholesterol oxidase n=1 Tax=Photobacterium galatheae TaxID=1654360 RepID=A0A066RRX8_9GAMM|nr:alpha/beta fold hydrolase [Photobacterium galatheae]KDM93104.1 choline dehydrogenase [Photobacterium galatheae]MCM0148368.1 GMC family oxidoreductase N-terminal domain-containing protein [Photobacterium galatheae]